MNPVTERLLAVLKHDGIAEPDQVKHLMDRCNLSRYLAKQALSGKLPRSGINLLNMADGLNIDYMWLWNGDFSKVHPRTFRIHMQQLRCYPKEETDQMIRLLVASCAGLHKARNLVNLVYSGQMTLLGAARLM